MLIRKANDLDRGTEVLVATNTETQRFISALPEGAALELEISGDGKKMMLRFPNDRDISLNEYAELAKKYQKVISDKTRIPKDMLDAVFAGQTKDINDFALLLRFYMDDLRQAEKAERKSRKNSPVLTQKRISRAEIAGITCHLLESVLDVEKFGQVTALVRMISNVDVSEAKKIAHTEERCKAALIKASNENVGVRELARLVEVSPKSVSLWLNEPEFLSLVEAWRWAMENQDLDFSKS